jgi:hypothetical protein
VDHRGGFSAELCQTEPEGAFLSRGKWQQRNRYDPGSVSIFAAAVMLATSAAASDIRRVVTGLDENNKARVIFDSRLPLATGPYGINSTNLWITDSYPLGFSDEDIASEPVGISPPENGTQFRVVEFGPLTPEIEQKMDPQLVMKAVGEAAPKRGLPVSHPMMHRTRSVDYAVVLSGEIDMVRRAAGDKSRLGQSRQGALPDAVRADGCEGAVTSAHMLVVGIAP